jgi:hypothetical protein
VNLTETEIKNIISKAIEVIMTQPMVLELEAPIKVCGNLKEKAFRWVLF